MPETYPTSLYLYALSNLISSVVFVGLAVFVFLQGRDNHTNRLFALWCLSVSVWALGVYKQSLATDYDSAVLWSRVLHASAGFIPALFLHFILNYLNSAKKQVAAILYAIAVGVFLLSVYPNPLLIKEVSPISLFKFYPKGGVAYPYFLLFFASCVLTGFYKLWSAYKAAPPVQRNQILYLLSAMMIGFGGGSTAFFHVFDLPVFPYGNYGLVAVCAAIISYAIVKLRLMDITVVIHKGLAHSLLLGLIFVPAYLSVVISHRATSYSIPPLAAASVILACGLWIVLKNPKATTNRTFGLICLAVCTWLFSMFMLYSTKRQDAVVFWGRIAYVGILYIPALFSHFCRSFLQLESGRRYVQLNYLISTLFLVLLPTSYFLNGQYAYFWGPYPKAGPLHPVFVGFFAAVSVVSLVKLYAGYRSKRHSAPLESVRIQYVFWAFVIGYLASSDFVQHYGVGFYPLGYVFVSFWVIIVSYAILKYQLLDIAQITRTQVLPYVQVLALIPSYFVILGLIRLFTGTMQFVLAGILLATAAIFAELFVTLQKRMEKVVEKALFRKRYDAYETLTEFSNAMVKMLDLRALNEKIIATLANVMGAKNVSLFLLDKEKNDYFLATAHGLDEERLRTFRIRENNPFAQYLKETEQIIVKEEWERHHPVSSNKGILSTLSMMESELCIPLKNKERLVGLLNLGPKANRRMYSAEDLNLLATLAQNAAIALDNAALYEELKRSQLLIRRTDRLRSLETMAGGFAHEIRNPLTSIKTFIQLAPDRRDDQEFFGHFSRLVYEDLARIERLIQEILDYARYMEPKFMEENLNEVVSSCLYFVEVKAESKAIILEKELAPDLPPVMLDRQQIKQVLLNLFLNALDALGDTGGRVTVRTHRLTKQVRDAWVQIEVADTGCGIAQADLDHIFDPFYTTKHESEEREGTGLGLTIVHQIIEEHGGYIEVESEVGRGTTFYINLPTNPHLIRREDQAQKETIPK